MEYKKIDECNYQLHLIKTKQFKTITVKVNFRRKLKKDEITIRNFLVNILFESCKKYPTKRLLDIETEELYELGYRGINYSSGNYSVMSLDSVFIDPKYTEDSMLEESIKFIGDVIMSPNVKNKEFDSISFDNTRNMMEDYLISLKENPDQYSMVRLFEEMEEDSPLSYRSIGYVEDLDKINRKNLYEYYQSVMKEDIIDIFIVGDIEDNIEDLIVKYLPFKSKAKKADSHFYEMKKIHEEPNVKMEKLDLKQSKLLMGLRMLGLTDFEKKYVLNVYNYLLGGSADSKLFQNVREKNSLCYSIHSSSQPLTSVISIKAGINAWDYDLACAIILEQLEDMRNGKFSDDDISKAVNTYKNGLKELEDSPDSILSLYSGIEYFGSDDIPNRIKKIESVTKDDVLKLASKVELDTIYFLEGNETYEETETSTL